MLVIFFLKKERNLNVPSLETQRLEVLILLLLLLLPFCVEWVLLPPHRVVAPPCWRRNIVTLPCAMVVVVVVALDVDSSVKKNVSNVFF